MQKAKEGNCMKSILARLEALEAKAPGTLILEIILGDGSTKEVNFSEFMAMRKEPYYEDGIYYPGVPQFRIVSGNNLNELDKVLVETVGECADLMYVKK